MDMTWVLTWIQPIAILIGASGIYAGLLSVKRQVRVTTYLEFTKRYAEVWAAMRQHLRRAGSMESLDKLDELERNKLIDAVNDYFDVLSMEYYLHRRGDVDNYTWQGWTLVMRRVFRISTVREVWRSTERFRHDSPNFSKFIETKIMPTDA